MTVGTISARTGIGKGTLFSEYARLSEILKPCTDTLMVCEVLQSVIESLRLCCANPVAKLTEALDAYAMDPDSCIPDLLFPLPTHKAELSRRRAGTRRV